MDTIDKIVEDADKYRSEQHYELAIDKYTEAIASLYASSGIPGTAYLIIDNLKDLFICLQHGKNSESSRTWYTPSYNATW